MQKIINFGHITKENIKKKKFKLAANSCSSLHYLKEDSHLPKI